MSLSLDDMRDLLREGAGNLTEDEMPDDKTDLLLNMSLWEIEDRFDFESKKKRFRFETVQSTSTYSLSNLNSPNSIRSVAIILDDGQRFKLARMTRDWYDENVQLSSDAETQPTKYLREGDCVFFNVDPDDAYLVEIGLQEGVESLVEGTTETTGLPRNWDELVVQGAIWKAHYFAEDYNRAEQAANFQVGGVRQAVLQVTKEESDSRYAGLGVLWEEPS